MRQFLPFQLVITNKKQFSKWQTPLASCNKEIKSWLKFFTQIFILNIYCVVYCRRWRISFSYFWQTDDLFNKGSHHLKNLFLWKSFIKRWPPPHVFYESPFHSCYQRAFRCMEYRPRIPHCNCIIILIWQTRFTEIAVSRKL